MKYDFEVDFETKNELGKKVCVAYKGEFEWVIFYDLHESDYEVVIDESSLYVQEDEDLDWRKLNISLEGYYSELANVIDANYREEFENQSPF
jgi:hypothetical protein